MAKGIIELEIPKNCIECKLLSNEDYCLVQDEDANFNANDSWDELRKGCPIKEVK
jgi:hypothetical protein